MIPIKDTVSGATFCVRIHPRAHKDELLGELGDSLKLAVTAPPVADKANEACIRFLAELLNLPRTSVSIAAGKTGRHKVVRVAGWSAEQVRRRLQQFQTAKE